MREPDGTMVDVTHPGPAFGTWRPERDVLAAWPAWDRKAERLAVFTAASDEAGPRVRVCDVNGLTDHASEVIPDVVPVYIGWSPDETHLATLVQDDNRLLLHAWRAATLDAAVELASASPLFLAWDDLGVVAFVGGTTTEPNRLTRLDPDGAAPGLDMSHEPRNFCVPQVRDGEVLYVADNRGEAALYRGTPGEQASVFLEPLDGLVAITLSPDGKALARAVAHGGDGSPYTDLALVDPGTGEAHMLYDEPMLAFLWTPDGTRLVLATVDTESNVLRWTLLDVATGATRELCTLRPTREMAFYLRFFEQYQASHPLIDPRGEVLVLGGELGTGPLVGITPHLWEVPLDGSEPSIIADGVIGIFPPLPSSDRTRSAS